MGRYSSILGAGLALAALTALASASEVDPAGRVARPRRQAPPPKPAPVSAAPNMPGETNRQYARRMKAEAAKQAGEQS